MPEYRFDEDKHAHYVDNEKYRNCTNVLDIIAKPALIQWAADLAAIEALSNRKDIGDVYEFLKKDYEEIQAINDPKEKKKAKNELDKKYPLWKECRLIHRQNKDKAAKWGTLVHKAIEVYIKTGQINESYIIKGEPIKIEPDHRRAIDQFIAWANGRKVEFLLSEKGIYSQEWRVAGICDFVCRIDGLLYIGDLKTSSSIYESYFLQVAAYGKMMMEMGLFEQFDRMIIINCRRTGEFDVEERKDVAGNIKCYEAALTLTTRLSEY